MADYIFIYHGRANQDRLVQFLGDEKRVKFNGDVAYVKFKGMHTGGIVMTTPGAVFIKVDEQVYLGVELK